MWVGRGGGLIPDLRRTGTPRENQRDECQLGLSLFFLAGEWAGPRLRAETEKGRHQSPSA